MNWQNDSQINGLGLIPMVIPPFSIDFPIPVERTPIQRGTDRGYLEEMARRFDEGWPLIEPGELEEGRSEIARGDFVRLEELSDALDTPAGR